MQCLHNLHQISPHNSPNRRHASTPLCTMGNGAGGKHLAAARSHPARVSWSRCFHRGVSERLATLRWTSRYGEEGSRGSASPSDPVLLRRRAQSLWGGELLYLRLRRPRPAEPDTTNRFIKSHSLRLCSHFIPAWKRHFARLVAMKTQESLTSGELILDFGVWLFNLCKTFLKIFLN